MSSSGDDLQQIDSTSTTAYLSNFPLTDFTKRRNWQQRILDNLPDLFHVLARDGRILYASPAAKELTGYEPAQLTGRLIGEFIHPDDANLFVKELDESAATGIRMRFFYRFRKKDGHWAIFESHGHAHFGYEHVPPCDQAGNINFPLFYLTARPYPTKMAALMDSFLEHKFDNIRLTYRLREFQHNEQEPTEPSPWHWNTTQGARRPAGVDEVSATETPENITLSMSQSNKQTQCTRTKDATVRGDMGIQYPLDRNDGAPRGRKNKKRSFVAPSQNVCFDCGTLDSPEWRKGPRGPKTLCNACGLRWSKFGRKDRLSLDAVPELTIGCGSQMTETSTEILTEL